MADAARLRDDATDPAGGVPPSAVALERAAALGEKGAAAREGRRQAGRWLKTLREQAGLTQADVAERIGLRYYTFVSQVEGGHGRVPSDQVLPWAAALGAEPRHFARVLLSHYDPDMHLALFGTRDAGSAPLAAVTAGLGTAPLG